MMNANLYEIIRAANPTSPDADFMKVCGEGSATGAAPTYSYGDIEAVSGRYARLLADLGVVKGDRIAVQVEKSPQAILLYLAAMRVGAVFLPLNTAYTDPEVAYFLADAEPKVVVCDPTRAESLGRLAANLGIAELLTLDAQGGGSLSDAAESKDPDFGCVAASADDLAAILYTSGTTGRSKGAMLSHENLASNAITLQKLWGFSSDDVLLHALPIFHTHGLFVATNCVLLSGASMLFLHRFDARQVIGLLPRATVMMGVPTFYTRLLAEPAFGAECCATMRLFISGSAPLLEETFAAFEARTGQRILERYGMTETGMNTSNPLVGDRLPGTVGPGLPGVEVRITDADGRILPDGEIGTLEVKGPNVFRGYWRQPQKTAGEFRADGFFITGDLARIDENGYVQIVGRGTDLIICGGFNVYPKEVELLVDGLEGVTETAVVGLPHPDFGEAVVAVVVRDADHTDLSSEAVIEAAKLDLANFKVPKRVYFVDSLPRNAMGKVQKSELRERYKSAFAPTI